MGRCLRQARLLPRTSGRPSSSLLVWCKVARLNVVTCLCAPTRAWELEGLSHRSASESDAAPYSLRLTPDLLPETWSSYYESPTAPDGRKEDSLWANDTPRSRSCASSARRRQS